jgi:hypothetical protein
MNKIYLSVSALFLSVGLMAQPQIDNSSFESWEGSGASSEPVDWSSLKTSDGGVSGLAPQVCFQSSDFHTGTSSARLKSISSFGQIATGIMTNGKMFAEISGNGYVFTDASNAANNTAITDRPDSLVVWYKTTPQGQDFPTLEAVLHTGSGKIPENGTLANWIGTASWNGNAGTTVSSFTRVSTPFVYTSSSAPAYILLAPAGGNGSSSVANSETWYDDFALIYNVTPVLSDVVAPVTALVGFPLTVNFSTAGTPVATTSFVAELSDASGSFASPVVIGSLTTAASSGAISSEIPANTPAGAGYLIRITNASPFYAPISTPIEVTQDVVGLAEANANAIRAYSSNGNVMVNLTGVQLVRPTYEVVNVAGQRIASGSFVAGQINALNFGGQHGIFILRVMDENNIISKKILVD